MFTGKKYWILFLLTIFEFSFFHRVNSQSIQVVLQHADSLLARGESKDALLLYDRILFFDDSSHSANSYEKIATCFFQNKQYDKAATYFSIAGKNSKDDSAAFFCFQKSTICLILGEQFQSAKEELLAMPDSFLQSQKGKLLSAITYYGNEETDAAFLEFSKIDALNRKPRELDRLRKRLKNVEKKNPKTAMILSMLIPGSGQIYAGDWKNGINSLLLTGSLMALGFYAIESAGFIDGIILVGPWFQRYYTGGYQRAESSVFAMKKQVRFEILQEILRLNSGERFDF